MTMFLQRYFLLKGLTAYSPLTLKWKTFKCKNQTFLPINVHIVYRTRSVFYLHCSLESSNFGRFSRLLTSRIVPTFGQNDEDKLLSNWQVNFSIKRQKGISTFKQQSQYYLLSSRQTNKQTERRTTEKY